MTRHERLSTSEREAAANAVGALGAYGIFTTGGPEEWAVHHELIAEAWQTHCCCIPSATSGWERNRTASYDMGYLVDQQNDPRRTPVKLWDGWRYLSEDGTLSEDLGDDD